MNFFQELDQQPIKGSIGLAQPIQHPVKKLATLPTLSQEPKESMQAPDASLFFDKQKELNCIWQRYSTENKKIVLPSRPPAKQYKFKLDAFQQKSVRCLQADQSVLVCAHTSAGKTAIAEYAIALSLNNRGRCIYTSPIKALSNQKYRDLKQQFQDVGLVTGDVTQNPSSGCLVMTTQILRSMIYRGSQIVRQVKWVIFDQCHYMRDIQRGVVWQECIEMLPKAVKLLFLSATIANATQFAKWVCTIKQQPCSVIYTDYRPVPLQHYVFATGSKGISLVVDQKGKFLQDNFNQAIQSIGDSGIQVIGAQKRRGKGGQGSDLQKIIKLLIDKQFNPVIVFSFSKKDVEGYAQSLQKFNFLGPEEKDRVADIFEKAINILSQEDRKLPQITTMKPILQKGIGIHHGGLLPIVKEVIEILFQQSLIKVLFSTETFSMGLNMPARTVVFTSVRKFDGSNFRWMKGGQYIQMSGRAGRRGKDKKGISVVMVDQKMQPQAAKQLLKGNSDRLQSSFHVNYSMLLNSIRLQDIDPEYIIRHSFLQYQTKAKIPQLVKKRDQLVLKANAIRIGNQAKVHQLLQIVSKADCLREQIKNLVNKPQNMLKHLRIGRLVHLKVKQVEWGWGLVINWTDRKSGKKKQQDGSIKRNIVVDIAVHTAFAKKASEVKPACVEDQGQVLVIPFTLQSIDQMSKILVILPQNITSSQSKQSIKDTLRSILRNNPIPEPIRLNPQDQLANNLHDMLKQLGQKLKTVRQQLGEDATKSLNMLSQKIQVNREISKVEQQITKSTEIVLKDQTQNMKRVLKRLDMLDQNSIITLKGSVACQIGGVDQIMLTELLFSGFFKKYNAMQTAAILSSIVHDQKAMTDRKYVKSPKLSQGLQQLRTMSKQLYKVYTSCRIQIDQEIYNDRIKEQLVQVTYQWCKGASFLQISKQTDSFEGSIIRTLKRLDQLLKKLEQGANIMGNSQLSEKFKQAASLMQRGIVFAASLYL